MGQLQTLANLPGFFIREACKACFAKRREEKIKPAKRAGFAFETRPWITELRRSEVILMGQLQTLANLPGFFIREACKSD